MVIEILSFSCYALFLVTATDGYLGMQSCKKIKIVSYNIKKHSCTKLDQFHTRVLKVVIITNLGQKQKSA